MKISRPISRQPIPKKARKVFKGALFDVYQWDQKQFDGSLKVFEKLKRPDTAYVIPITNDGKLILTKQHQPGASSYVGLIGGRVNEKESPDQAARRELLEESGLIPGSLMLWDSFQFLPKIDWAIYIFIAKNCSKKKQQSLDSGEQIELFKVSFNEFLKIISQEIFGDVEVAMKVLRTAKNKENFMKMKKMFLG